MERVPLYELYLAVTVRGEGPEEYEVAWTLRMRPEYPPRPGHRTDWRVLGQHRSAYEPFLSPRRLSPERLFPSELFGLRERLREEHQRGSWARVAVEARYPAAELAYLTWPPGSALFADLDVPVVHRHRSDPWAAERPPLEFPLRLCVLGADSAAPRLFDEHTRRALEMNALCLVPELEDADIVHLSLDPQLPPVRSWAMPRERAARRLRVAVIHDPHAVMASSELAVRTLGGLGLEAVIHAVGPWERYQGIYRDLLHDRPLDVCVQNAHKVPGASIVLHGRTEGETCLSLSGLVDAALYPEPGATRIRDVPGAPDEDSLRRAWSDVLWRPLETLADLAEQLTIREELGDLQHAMTLAADARALRRELPVIDRALRQLAQSHPDRVAAASTRVTEVTVLEPDTDVPLAPETSLAIDRDYRLRVQIVRSPEANAWAAELFPEQAMQETLLRLDVAELTVMIYADPRVVRLSVNRARLALRALGDSAPLVVSFTALRPGAIAIRVCLYYGTALLQAVLVEGNAGDPVASRPIASWLDYAASSDLMLLDRAEQPDVTIWTNQAADGTHWIGVFTGSESEACGLANGTLATLTTRTLDQVAKGLHGMLAGLELQPAKKSKEQARYRFEPPRPEGDQQRGDRRKQLAALARAGWNAYCALFEQPSERSPAAATRQGLLSIALCRPEHPNVPWAALYDYHLDTDRPEVCEVFDAQLQEQRDLLDHPEHCRARADCPLSQPRRASRTVCPFGFWGIRHRIEQPLHHIRPPAPVTILQTSGDEGEPPPTLTAPLDYAQLQHQARHMQVIARPVDQPRIAIAFWPHFGQTTLHHLHAVAALGSSEMASDRDQILDLLACKDRHIYYFYCHGDGGPLAFRLRVGPSQEADAITAPDLNHDRYRWPSERVAPLVFLNGCDTQAFRTDTINKLMQRFRANGASGVIGTEIPVHTQLAADVGHRILGKIAAGERLGDAFLAVRRDLLREQYNPLGLAYTFFASARLHLCRGPSCTACPGTANASSRNTERGES